MGKPIPVALQGAHDVPVDGALVARAFGLDVATFRRLMDERRITVLCERGTGADAGLHRATFYHEDRRVRLVVDGDGTPRGDIEVTKVGERARSGAI